MTRRRWRYRIAAAALVLAGCSSSRSSHGPQDAGVAQDAGADATVDCIQMQRDYVAAKLAPAPPSDVGAAVHGVLGASDFPQAMPYCSGPRPTSP